MEVYLVAVTQLVQKQLVIVKSLLVKLEVASVLVNLVL